MALKPLTLKEFKRSEREEDKGVFDYLREKPDVDGREAYYSKENKENEHWDGMEECEDILERDNSKDTITLEKDNLSNEKVFEELHRTNEGKDTLGDRDSSKEKIQVSEKQKAPKMEEYVKQREDGLLAMSAGNVIHYQLEQGENMTGQNFLNQSSQVVTEDYHNEREFAMSDDVVEDAFDMEENIEIDDIEFDGALENENLYNSCVEESDRMAFPDLDDEPAYSSGEKELTNRWSN